MTRYSKATIEEPPFESLRKRKSSCLKRGCTIGCGCLVLLVGAGIFGLSLLFTPRPKSLDTLPAWLQNEIDIYDPSSLQSIMITKQRKDIKRLEEQWSSLLSKPPKPTDQGVLVATWTELAAPGNYIEAHYIASLKRHHFLVETMKQNTVTTIHFSNQTDLVGTIMITDNTIRRGTEEVTLRIIFDEKRENTGPNT